MLGRIALVTGGSRGLGRAITLRLAADGFVPVLTYLCDHASAKEALSQARILAPEARAYAADLNDGPALEALVARVASEVGPIDVLVNNAYRSGRTARKTHEVDPKEFVEDLATNLSAQFLMSRACVPSMLKRGFGRIVFIGSLAMHGERGRVAYATAKSALVGLMRTMAEEYAKDGITANIVSPGFIESGAFTRFSEEIRQRALQRVPSKRAGRPEDVAAAVAYLCSEDAGYTTGQVLGIDGGAGGVRAR